MTTASYSLIGPDEVASGEGIQQWDVALAHAQHSANRSGETWHICGTDEDGDEIEPYAVEPDVTDDQILALRAEAAAAGDSAQVAVCDRALAGDTAAIRECARVIADAAAQVA